MNDYDPTVGNKILGEVLAERIIQVQDGYTPEHDDEHGLPHILDQVVSRLTAAYLSQAGENTRDELLEATALLVAAVEYIDRNS